MLFIAILIILLLSFLFSLLSLKKELHKSEQEKAKEVKDSLAKGRVLFYSPSSPSKS